MSPTARTIRPRALVAAIAALGAVLIALAVAPAALAAIRSSESPVTRSAPPPPAAPSSPDLAAAEARVDAFIATHPPDDGDAQGRPGSAAERLEQAVATSMGCQRAAGATVLEDPADPSGYTASYTTPSGASGEADAERFSALLRRCSSTYERDAELAAHPERGPAGEAAFLDLVRRCAAEASVAIPELRVRADIAEMTQASWDAIFPCIAEATD